jgi:predicted dehydrogenase
VSSGGTIRLGLIGAGRWGRNYISTIARLDGVELAYLVSHNPASRDLVDAGCRISDSWRDPIEAGDLDGLIVATGPAIQGEIAIAAMGAGLPLMLEKPVTTDVASTQRLLDLSMSVGVPVLVDHVYLFSAAFAALKQEIPHLGGLRSLRASRGSWGPFRANLRALWDWAPHDLAMCIDLAGTAPERIEGRMLKDERMIDGDGETIRLDLAFSSGIATEITIGNLMKPPKRLFTAVCQNGEMIFDDLADDKLVCLSNAGRIAIPLVDDPPLSRAVDVFARGIGGGDLSAFGLDLAVDVARVIAEVERQLEPKDA